MKQQRNIFLFVAMGIYALVIASAFIIIGSFYKRKDIEQSLDTINPNYVFTVLWHKDKIVWSSLEEFEPKNIDSVMTAEYNKAKKVQNALNKR